MDSWQDRAACRGFPTSMFFEDIWPQEGVAANPVALARARAICDDCPVQMDCVLLGRDERYGVFGGFTPAERRRVL